MKFPYEISRIITREGEHDIMLKGLAEIKLWIYCKDVFLSWDETVAMLWADEAFEIIHCGYKYYFGIEHISRHPSGTLFYGKICGMSLHS